MPKPAVLRALQDDPPVVWLFWLAFIGFAVGALWVVGKYGGLAFWPVLFGSFGASLAAFVLALSWDREQERRRSQQAADALVEDRERETREHYERLKTEAGRRLEPIRKELSRNKTSIDDLVKALPAVMAPPAMPLHRDLLEGAWQANAPRLSEILVNYELVGDLATTYGRIEELRWRLRQRTELIGVHTEIATGISELTRTLAGELAVDVADLLGGVEREIENPQVQAQGALIGQVAVEVLIAAPHR